MFTHHLEELGCIFELEKMNEKFTKLLKGRKFEDLTLDEKFDLYVLGICFRFGLKDKIVKEYELTPAIKQVHGFNFEFASSEYGYPVNVEGFLCITNLDVKELGWCVVLNVRDNNLTLETCDLGLDLQELIISDHPFNRLFVEQRSCIEDEDANSEFMDDYE